MRTRDVPVEEIRFAAKMGFLSKSIWEEFFRTNSRSWRSRLWRRLTESKLFRPHPSVTAKDVIVLNPSNPKVQEIVGGEISSPPYVGHLHHDEGLSRILLRLTRLDMLLDFTSEAEQKRRHQDDRHWYRRHEKLKFPDAILDLKCDDTMIKVALELELTAKCQKRYRKIFDTYQDRKQVHAVIFVINSTGTFKALTKAIKDSRYPDTIRPVGFARLDEWLVDPENAPIRFRDGTTSLKEMGTSKIFHQII